MKLRKQTFKHLPIHKQFLFITGIFLFIIATFAVMIFHSMQKDLITNANTQAEISTQKSLNELEVLCLKLDVLCSQIQSDSVYKELLLAPSYQSISPQTVSDINSNISYIKCLNTDIADIAFANDLIHYSSLFSEEDLTIMYHDAMNEERYSNHGVGFRKSSFLPFADQIYYVYCSHIYQNGKVIGCIFVSLNVDHFSLDQTEKDSSASFYITDYAGNIFSLSDKSEDIPEEIMSAVASSSPADSSYYPYSVQITYSDIAQCGIISAVHIPAIRSMLDDTWRQIWILVISIAILTSLLLVVSYVSMIIPLNQFSSIINKMRNDHQRHLSEPLDIDGCQEVRQLAMEFSNMFSTIDELNAQIFETSSKLYEAKIRGQATEISFFRSQINPHFLYNVLELIRSLALSHQVPEIASIAVAMGKMYRYNTKGAPIVPFAEELEMTKAYIEIQKYRFQDKFDIIYNIPEDILSVPVIKIILQPIVENSIQHGIEPSLNKCMLYIGCTILGNDLIIEIRDDGVGMEPEKLQEMQTLLLNKNYDSTKYVGIANTNARLKLQYGNDYGISIHSEENDGTVVTIRMPITTQSES